MAADPAGPVALPDGRVRPHPVPHPTSGGTALAITEPPRGDARITPRIPPSDCLAARSFDLTLLDVAPPRCLDLALLDISPSRSPNLGAQGRLSLPHVVHQHDA